MISNYHLKLLCRREFIHRISTFSIRDVFGSTSFREKKNRAKEIYTARLGSNMTNETGDPITFNSRSKLPYSQFSNFYEAEIRMSEGIFASVEHYFQAMKFLDKDHKRFEVEGDLGRQRYTKGKWKETMSKARFIKTAGGKSGTKKYKLQLRKDGLERRRNIEKMTQGLNSLTCLAKQNSSVENIVNN